MKTSSFEIAKDETGNGSVLVFKGEFTAPNPQHVPVIEALAKEFAQGASAVAGVTHDGKGSLHVTVTVIPAGPAPAPPVQTSAKPRTAGRQKGNSRGKSKK